MILEYYQQKENAQKAARELSAKLGEPVRAKSVRNCVLDPDAVRDYTGHRSPNGFGGSADQWWSRLYKIEVWLR